MISELTESPISPEVSADSELSDIYGTNRATYEPESNKLRLYIGRVPREEYLKLKAEGWTALHKQREAGGGDFVATWTPSRRDTALEYAGIIEDEDMSTQERAADRAERFSGYLDKRMDEATGHADRYDAGPAFHGFQNKARAVRAADRHDRIAGRAVDAWEKAEYWQRRTAGVIANALHKCSPSVRMGRIKELETSLRRSMEAIAEGKARWKAWKAIAAMEDAEAQTAAAIRYTGGSSGLDSKFKHPRPEEVENSYIRENGSCLYTLLTMSGGDYGKPITGAEACALYFGKYREPGDSTEWSRHYELRLAYENQMLEAQGGRAGVVEMVPGGWLIGGRRLSGEARQIVKVNKSPVTGRVVSVLVRDNRPSFHNHYGNPYPDGVARILSHTVEVERAGPECYRAPTEEELAEFQAKEKASKKARKASAPPPIPLINPTDDDAERLQTIWNERAKDEYMKHNGKYGVDFRPSTVCRITQAQYSANSSGSFARAETVELCRDAQEKWDSGNMYSSRVIEHNKRIGAVVCKIRTTYGDGNTTNKASRVIILTDKPQKPLPLAVWEQAVAVDQTEPVNA